MPSDGFGNDYMSKLLFDQDDALRKALRGFEDPLSLASLALKCQATTAMPLEAIAVFHAAGDRARPLPDPSTTTEAEVKVNIQIACPLRIAFVDQELPTGLSFGRSQMFGVEVDPPGRGFVGPDMRRAYPKAAQQPAKSQIAPLQTVVDDLLAAKVEQQRSDEIARLVGRGPD